MKLSYYGLRRNPFDVQIPPPYKGEGWCFANITTEDNREIIGLCETFISRIKNRAQGPRGILIVGEWGTGKTHVLRYILGRLKEEGFTTIEKSGGISIDKTHKAALRYFFDEDDPDKIVDNLNENRTIIGIDEAQFLIDLSEVKGEFPAFIKTLKYILEKLDERKASGGVAIAITKSLFRKIEDNFPDVPDRFEPKIFLKDNINKKDAEEIVKEYLSAARPPGWENDLPSRFKEAYEDTRRIVRDSLRSAIWPFTVGSIDKLIELWKLRARERGRRKIRDFIMLCRDTLEYCAEKELDRILPGDVESAMDRFSETWRNVYEEWATSGIRKQKILINALHYAMGYVIADPESGIAGRAKGASYDLGNTRVNLDMIVNTTQGKNVILEVETNRTINQERYKKIKRLILNQKENFGFAGIVILCTSQEIANNVQRVLIKNVFPAGSYRVVVINENDPVDSTYVLGRILAFAAIDDEFPQDIDLREEIKSIIDINLAKSALDSSGLLDSIRSLI